MRKSRARFISHIWENRIQTLARGQANSDGRALTHTPRTLGLKDRSTASSLTTNRPLLEPLPMDLPNLPDSRNTLYSPPQHPAPEWSLTATFGPGALDRPRPTATRFPPQIR